MLEKFEKLIEKIEILLPVGDEETIDAAFHELLDEVASYTNNEYRTFNDFQLFFVTNRLLAKNFIRKNDNLTLMIRAVEWRLAYEDIISNADLTEDERLQLQKEYLRLNTIILDYLKKEKDLQSYVDDYADRLEADGEDMTKVHEIVYPPVDEINVRSEKSKCLLCKSRTADAVGSHMVPHCLIEKLFSYDGKKGRDREVVERFTLGKGERQLYIGRNITDEKKIVSLINRNLRDDEQGETSVHNPLTFDHYFCKHCEERLSVIEREYANVMRGVKQYHYAVPYLFWMSVTWRMSISKMGISLPDNHAEKYRSILDKTLALTIGEIKSNSNKMGHCAYTIQRVNQTKGKQTGILGIPVPTIPAHYMIGDLMVNFYHSLDKARKCQKVRTNPLPVNDGKSLEQISEATFIEFWQMKRKILDENFKRDYDYNPEGEFSTGISQFIRYENVDEKRLEETGQIYQSRFDIQNKGKYRLVIPAAIDKMMRYRDAHPEATIEETSKALGYTGEEMAAMIRNFSMI